MITRNGTAPLVVMLFVALTGLAAPALADIGDISVGGVWVCRLARGAFGLTLEQRVTLTQQRLTEVLSIPELTRAIPVEVRVDGPNAAIIAAGVTIITVTPGDTAGTRVPVHEVANQWAARLAEGLRRALPGREVLPRMYVPSRVPPAAAAPALVGELWFWRRTQMSNDTVVVPDDSVKYAAQFRPNGQLAVNADCNRGGGTYAVEGNQLTLVVLQMTRVACRPGSFERRYLAQLREVVGYLLRDGDLFLTLRLDSGTMRFSRVPQ